jgi:hypothetical protein
MASAIRNAQRSSFAGREIGERAGDQDGGGEAGERGVSDHGRRSGDDRLGDGFAPTERLRALDVLELDGDGHSGRDRGR